MPDRHHLVIAGTGRAGTTFLVRFLAECGVPAGDLDDQSYFDEGRAGLERSLLTAGDVYLVKDAWFFEYVDEIDLSSVTVDAVIMPVRNLRHAALSRIRQERAGLVQGGWPSRWSTRPGGPAGGIFSMSVQEQERVLALGFVKQVEWCVTNDVELMLLQFPRLVNDREYLIDALWPVLDRFCTREHARSVFDRWAKPEPWLLDSLEETDIDIEIAEQSIKTEAALVAADRIRAERDELRERLDGATRSLAESAVRYEQAVDARAEAMASGDEARELLAERNEQLDRLGGELEVAHSDLARSSADLQRANDDVERLRLLLDDALAQVDVLRGSKSARIAQRMRALQRRLGLGNSPV